MMYFSFDGSGSWGIVQKSKLSKTLSGLVGLKILCVFSLLKDLGAI
jgi:hypothetical protein